MSSVPYTFATDTGNIPLSQLDANFANVKASVDTAIVVTASAQPNITSVGTLTSVSVTGNITGGNLRTSGLISATGNTTSGNLLTGGLISATGTVTGSSYLGTVVSASGNITGGNIISGAKITSSSKTAGIGYATGAGNTVAQGTNRSTGVTINAVSGAITLFSVAGNTTYTTFTVTNSAVANTDVVIVNQRSGADKYEILVSNVATGSFALTVSDKTGTTAEAPVINFAVIKAVTA